jgi:tripartite ATP-independent transporter DctP family solute receptor
MKKEEYWMKSKTLKMLAMVLALVFALTIVGCGGGTKDTGEADKTKTEPIKLRIGTTVAPDHSYTVAAQGFKKTVEEKTNGAVTVDYQGAGVMGGERQMVEAVARGDLEMTMTSDIGLAAMYPELGFVNLPYLFESYEDVDKNYRNGWVGEYVAKYVEPKGVIVLATGENDFRGLTNSKRPITKGADLNGLKIRVPEIPMYIDFYKSMGVLPTPMAITELTTALQQKTVDGQDNGAIITYDNGLQDFQKYATKANHIYSAMQMCISKKTWDKLTPDQQKIVKDAAIACCDEQVKLNRENVADRYAKMTAAGMEVIDATPQLTADFKAVAARMYKDPQYDKAYTKEIMDKVREMKGVK